MPPSASSWAESIAGTADRSLRAGFRIGVFAGHVLPRRARPETATAQPRAPGSEAPASPAGAAPTPAAATQRQGRHEHSCDDDEIDDVQRVVGRTPSVERGGKDDEQQERTKADHPKGRMTTTHATEHLPSLRQGEQSHQSRRSVTLHQERLRHEGQVIRRSNFPRGNHAPTGNWKMSKSSRLTRET
jgi:hypothetical protein